MKVRPTLRFHNTACLHQNQIAFAFMGKTLSPPSGVAAVAPGQALSQTSETLSAGLGQLIGVLTLAGAAILALVASGASQPLLLTMLASLAMLGAFFVFGVAAGHVRIGARLGERDFARGLLEGFEEGVLVTDRDGLAIYSNRALEAVLGWRAGAAPVSIETAFGGNLEGSEAIYRLTRAAARGEPWREELIAPAGGENDDPRILRIAHRPFFIPGKERETGPLVLWTLQDITQERAQASRQVHSLEAAIAAYDQAPVGLLSVAPDGTIRQISTTFASWLGSTSPSIAKRGVKLGDLLSADGLDLVNASALRAGRDGASLDVDVTGDDARRLAMTLVVRRQSDGGLLIAARNRESTGLFDAPDASAEARFATFFRSAPFGIATVSGDGLIASANSAFARMILDGSSGLGAPAIDMLTRHATPAVRKEIDQALKSVFTGKAQPVPIEITVGREQEYSRRVYMSPIAKTDDAREAAILYVLDATEQKALEAKFAQSTKMEAVGKLAGGIAHDFNNVLTAIIGFSDLLLQTHRPTDPAYNDIMNIRSSANRAAGLVAKLLAFSRRQTLHTESLQLGEVVTDLASLLRRSIGETIELKVTTGRDLWFVKTDKTQFEHVIINLAVNARDAMPDGGTVNIRTRNVTEREVQKLSHLAMPLGEYVLIEVEDTGTGMTGEVLAKIFEPFFTTKEIGKGTGLGLATVYGIVKQSGGFIYPESAPGKGTTFRVYLPRHIPGDEVEQVAQKSNKKERHRDLTGTGRVLLVEDEDVVRNFAARALKRQGYEVLEAATGIEALEVMASNEGKIDIVVSDVVMPEMDGPTLLKELRKTNPELKIVFVSGYPHEAFETSLAKDEQFAFLPKPFSLPQLAAKVKEQLTK